MSATTERTEASFAGAGARAGRRPTTTTRPDDAAGAADLAPADAVRVARLSTRRAGRRRPPALPRRRLPAPGRRLHRAAPGGRGRRARLQPVRPLPPGSARWPRPPVDRLPEPPAAAREADRSRRADGASRHNGQPRSVRRGTSPGPSPPGRNRRGRPGGAYRRPARARADRRGRRAGGRRQGHRGGPAGAGRRARACAPPPCRCGSAPPAGTRSSR